jgi:hypothetical protein
MGKSQKVLEVAIDASNQAKQLQQELTRLQRQVKRLRAVSKVLWQLARDRLNVPEEELVKLVDDLERSEKEVPQIADLCPHCGRSLQDDHAKCIYCGADAPRQGVL